MSKKNEQHKTLDAKMENDNKKKYSKLQWFIFVIIIPFLFAIAVVLVVLTVSGLNVFDLFEKYSGNVPIVSEMTNDENIELDEEQTMLDLRATIEDQKVQIDTLNSDIETKENELETYQQKLEELENELRLIQETEQKAASKLTEIATLYETMSAKKSAAILSEMVNDEVVDIVVNMNTETRAAVLERMDPIKAAEITLLLKAQETNNDETSNETDTQNQET